MVYTKKDRFGVMLFRKDFLNITKEFILGRRKLFETHIKEELITNKKYVILQWICQLILADLFFL